MKKTIALIRKSIVINIYIHLTTDIIILHIMMNDSLKAIEILKERNLIRIAEFDSYYSFIKDCKHLSKFEDITANVYHLGFFIILKYSFEIVFVKRIEVVKVLKL